MDTLLKADVFFFITTIAIFFVTILLAVALFYAIRILRDTQQIVRRTKEESEGWFEDMRDLRVFLRTKGEKLAAMQELARSVRTLFGKRKRKTKNDE